MMPQCVSYNRTPISSNKSDVGIGVAQLFAGNACVDTADTWL
jgi:hypothetical protein